MNAKRHLIPLILASGLVAGTAMAAEDDIERSSNVMISAEIGAITTSGNTSGTSLTGKFEALQDTPLWSNEYTGNGYLKATVPLLQQGSFRLDATVSDDS